MKSSGAVLGAAALLAGFADRVSLEHRSIPAAGLPRDRIHLAIDRRAVRRSSSSALTASDWTVAGAVAFPVVLGLAADRRDGANARVSGASRRLTLFAEASLLTDAVTVLLKRSIARPRPSLYRPQAEGERRADSWSLASFPSGHATRAGCAVTIGILDHLRTRPRAPWMAHFMVGAAGGALASVTGALRVEGGAHFPSDVWGGVLIGVASGSGVSLLHRYRSASGASVHPPRSAWVASAGGLVAGSLLVTVLASAIGPS